MGFSVLSSNPEHFGGGETIKEQDPGIFGILEVENADIRKLMETSFPDYDFFLTDGPQLGTGINRPRQEEVDDGGLRQVIA